jgi:peptidyl-prolyl cis-trans isomerase D
MLQKIRESTGRWIAAGILGLIAVTFVFFGIDFSLTGATFAAKVNGENIPLLEFERELQRTQNQYQQLYPVELTPDLRRELRRSVVDRMVLAKALEQRADDVGYRVSDDRLREAIRTSAAFQVGGQFSPDVYAARLNSEGLSPTGFERLQRQQMELTELQNGILDSTFLTPAEFRQYIRIFNERRELSYALFAAQDFLDAVEVTDEQVAEHYEANAAQYMSEETVDIEYVELDKATVAAEVEVDESELEQYYEEQRERFETAEERQARHILIDVEDDDDAAAAEQAEVIEERLAAGEDFAALAAELSDDAGTRDQGGDLGWIRRGLLPGAFEDTLFSMQVGEVSAPVRSDFGYHIIRLDDIRAGQQASFDEVRDELATEYQTEQAEDRFYDRANQLDELAFDAYDELASVATELGVPLKTLMGYPRSGDATAFENNAPVVQAAFDDDSIASGNNSRLIELGDDRVLVLRVTAHHPPAQLPLDEVSADIREELERAAAAGLAEMAAGALLMELDTGGIEDPATAAQTLGGTWQAASWVERNDGNVPTEVLAAAFAVRDASAPVREVVPMASGDVAVMVLTAIEAGNPDAVSRDERDQRQQQLAQTAGIAEMNAYALDARQRAKVRIPDEVLNPQL